MELRMNGRNALVTGGSKGIGLAIARSFAEAGANVAIAARQQKSLDEAKSVIAAAAANTKVITVAADVGTADGCRKAFEAADKAFGQLDVLVGCVEVPVSAVGRHLVEPLRGRDQPNGEDFEPVAGSDLNGINEGRVVDDHGSFGLLRSVVGG